MLVVKTVEQPRLVRAHGGFVINQAAKFMSHGLLAATKQGESGILAVLLQQIGNHPARGSKEPGFFSPPLFFS
jgi:hypothetical protein